MKVAVTGANGFVGSYLVPRLLDGGHDVIALTGPARQQSSSRLPDVEQAELDLRDPVSIRHAFSRRLDAVIHLAAVASGSDARRDVGFTWEINAAGTARVAECLAHAESAPLLLYVSTGEVYGAGPATPRVETDPTCPCSPYAASKLGGETAVGEIARRTGLNVIIARAFPHSGAGQDHRFVIPAFAQRLVLARSRNAPAVNVGNLEVVRDFLHVADVVEAYVLLLERGEPGNTYNVASGRGKSLRDVFDMLSDAVGYRAVPETDASLMRRADIPYLVGDAAKLRRQTGWNPSHELQEMLREVVDAETN